VTEPRPETVVSATAARGFTAGVDAYERSRPDYPAAAVNALVARMDLRPERTVLDLGAGTGKLTRLLVPSGATVVAVEPLEAMRARLEAVAPSVTSLSGTAEAIPLPDASVDAVFVAEAFHWFDLDRAPAEIARVLRPGGHLAVLFNQLDTDEPWFADLHEIVMAHRLPGPQMPHTVPWREAIEAQFGALSDEEGPHEHVVSRDEQVAQIASFSSIGGLPQAQREAALAECRAVLERYVRAYPDQWLMIQPALCEDVEASR